VGQEGVFNENHLKELNNIEEQLDEGDELGKTYGRTFSYPAGKNNVFDGLEKELILAVDGLQ
jgi:hypothetical protein